jgi:15-cis-phytoene synthase
VNVDEAYEQCERITWEQARNFAYGIRLLPPAKRRALAAVYAYARRIDDIGDGDLAPEVKTEQLEAARRQVHALVAAGEGIDETDPVLVALADSGARFPVPLEAFTELIDGCLADVQQRGYKTFDDLLWYCRCVAGSIGRLSLGIYGPTQPEKQAVLADDLGVALQLTNILRDVREDFRKPEPFPSEAMQARFATLVEFEAARAREWYASGLRLLATIDRRSAACTGAMAGIYRRLLERIDNDPSATLRQRVSLPGGEKALVAVQALAGFDRWKYSARLAGGDDPPATPRSGASSAGGEGASK